MFKNEIVEWNRERGLLDKFDPALEIKMLSEEAREFYNAKTFEHKLCEYADFLFVREGTMAKYHCQTGQTTASFSFSRDAFVQLMEWTVEVQDNMLALLVEEFENNIDSLSSSRIGDMTDCLSFALNAVVINNNLKGKTKVDGKVQKSPDQLDPVQRVKEFIYED